MQIFKDICSFLQGSPTEETQIDQTDGAIRDVPDQPADQPTSAYGQLPRRHERNDDNMKPDWPSTSPRSSRQADPEESRLFGFTKKWVADQKLKANVLTEASRPARGAVAIPIPSSAQGGEPSNRSRKPALAKGIQPRNTLHHARYQSNQAPAPAKSEPPRHTNRGGHLISQNIPKNPPWQKSDPYDLEIDPPEKPSPKRQKTRHMPSESEIIDISDDEPSAIPKSRATNQSSVPTAPATASSRRGSISSRRQRSLDLFPLPGYNEVDQMVNYSHPPKRPKAPVSKSRQQSPTSNALGVERHAREVSAPGRGQGPRVDRLDQDFPPRKRSSAHPPAAASDKVEESPRKRQKRQPSNDSSPGLGRDDIMLRSDMRDNSAGDFGNGIPGRNPAKGSPPAQDASRDRRGTTPLRQKFVRITNNSGTNDADGADDGDELLVDPIRGSNETRKDLVHNLTPRSYQQHPRSPNDIPKASFISKKRNENQSPSKPHKQPSTTVPKNFDLASFESCFGERRKKVPDGALRAYFVEGQKHFTVVYKPNDSESQETTVELQKLTHLKQGQSDSGDKIWLGGVEVEGSPLALNLTFADKQFADRFRSHLTKLTTFKKQEDVSGDVMGKHFRQTRKITEHREAAKSRKLSRSYGVPILEDKDQKMMEEVIKEEKADAALRNNPEARPKKLISQLRADAPAEPSEKTVSSKRGTRTPDEDQSAFVSPRTTRSSNRIMPEKPINDKETSPERPKPIYALGRPWKYPVVYPPTGKDRATVEFSDLQRLDEGEFLNDNLVMFYLRWAMHKANLPENQVYIFNNFFYTKLTTLAKGQRGINYAGVRRWTAAVDIFAYDYVVCPINEDFHWYVAIICNLTKIKRSFEGSNPEEPLASSQSEDATERKSKDDQAGNIDGRLMSEGEDTLPTRTAGLRLNDTPENKQDKPAVTVRKEPGQGDVGHEELPTSVEQELREATQKPLTNEEEPSQSSLLEESATGLLPAPTPKPSNFFNKTRKKRGAGGRTYDPNEPIIIILDSLDSSHPKTAANLKQYLKEEGKAKRSIDVKVDTAMKATGIPQQSNFCDCGIYLLGYIDKFLKNPREFVTKILRREMDPEIDWPDMKPPDMRDHIRQTLLTLQKEQRAERLKLKKGNPQEAAPNEAASDPALGNMQTQIQSEPASEGLQDSQIPPPVSNTDSPEKKPERSSKTTPEGTRLEQSGINAEVSSHHKELTQPAPSLNGAAGSVQTAADKPNLDLHEETLREVLKPDARTLNNSTSPKERSTGAPEATNIVHNLAHSPKRKRSIESTAFGPKHKTAMHKRAEQCIDGRQHQDKKTMLDEMLLEPNDNGRRDHEFVYVDDDSLPPIIPDSRSSSVEASHQAPKTDEAQTHLFQSPPSPKQARGHNPGSGSRSHKPSLDTKTPPKATITQDNDDDDDELQFTGSRRVSRKEAPSLSSPIQNLHGARQRPLEERARRAVREYESNDPIEDDTPETKSRFFPKQKKYGKRY